MRVKGWQKIACGGLILMGMFGLAGCSNEAEMSEACRTEALEFPENSQRQAYEKCMKHEKEANSLRYTGLGTAIMLMAIGVYGFRKQKS